MRIRAWLSQHPSARGAYRRVKELVRPHRRPALVFVLGSERSGLNVLRRSLSLDPYVQGFDECQNGEFYVGWSLRPEREIRTALERFPGTVLVKSSHSVVRRPVPHLLAEFASYDHRTVWIYRDPVAVYRSRRDDSSTEPELAAFLEEWNRSNASALDALGVEERLAVVGYHQLTSDGKAFPALATWLGIRGENLFRPGRPATEIEAALPVEVVATIRKRTRDTLERLEAAASAFLDENLSSAAGEDEA